MKNLFLFITILILAISCRKINSTDSTIIGKWTIRLQNFAVNPSPIQFGYFPFTTNESVENNDSLSIEFNANGSYTLVRPFVTASNNFTPSGVISYPTNGNYRIFQDSFLIIQSDTALLKSTYTYAANYPFPNGDTIYFKTISSDSLYFLQRWSAPTQITADSVATLYYICLSGFKKIN